MLALTVRDGDYITIGDEIVVQVLKAGETFRLAVDAPRSMRIERSREREKSGAVPECIRRAREQAPVKKRTRKEPPAPPRDG